MRGVGSGLSPGQRRNAQILLAASKRPIIRKAIVEAGLVESGLHHLTGGDRDSTGILQQRPSQGWGPVGESVSTDAAQFVRAAQKVLAGGFSGSAGKLAQAVQRSQFPARYDAQSGTAEALLRGAGSSGGGGGSPAAPVAGQTPGFDPGDIVAFWDMVSRQDWGICEREQTGVGSRAYAEGGVYPWNDRWVYEFNGRYRQCFTSFNRRY